MSSYTRAGGPYDLSGFSFPAAATHDGTSTTVTANVALGTLQTAVDSAPLLSALTDNRTTIGQGTDAAMAVLTKIGNGTVPGTSTMPAQLATLLSFLPANDTAATTAAHGLLMIRAEAKLTRLLVRLVRGDFSGTS